MQHQILLVMEILAYTNEGKVDIAKEKGKEYLKMDVIKMPILREYLEILVGLKKYQHKSDEEFLREAKKQVMELLMYNPPRRKKIKEDVEGQL